MAFEVAEVFATLRFQAEGAQDAVRDAQSIQEALNNTARVAQQRADLISRAEQTIAQAMHSSSLAIQEQGRELQAQVDALTRFSSGVEAADDALSVYGVSMAELTSTIGIMRAETQGLEDAVASQAARVEEASVALEREKAAAEAVREETSTLSDEYAAARERVDEFRASLEAEKKALNETEEALRDHNSQLGELESIARTGQDIADAFPEAQRRGFADLEGGVDNLTRKLGPLARNFNLNQTALTGLVSTLRTGRIGSALFAQALRPLIGVLSSVSIGAVGLAAAVAALPFVSVVAGWKLLNSEWGQAADRLNSLNPEVVTLARSLDNLSGVGVGQVAAALDAAERRFESFGISEAQSRAIAERLAEAADFAQFLTPEEGDFDRVFQSLQRAVETLNFSNLRDLGINVNQLNIEMERLAREGVPEAQRQGIALNMIMGQLQQKTDEVSGAVARSKDTFAGLIADIRAIFNAARESEEFQAVMEDLVAAFREWLPLVAGAAKAMAALLVVVAKVSQAALKLIDNFFFLFGLIGFIAKGLKELGDDALDDLGFGDLEDVIDSVIGGIDNTLDEVVQGTEQAEDAVREFSDSLSTIQGLEGQLRRVGQAFADLSDGLDPGEVTDFVASIGSTLDFIAQRGAANVRASLEAEAELLKEFFAEGFITLEQYSQGLDDLEAKRRFADPLISKVEEMERGFANTESEVRGVSNVVSGSLTPSIDGAASSLANATGQAMNFTNALNNIPSSVSVDIITNQIQSGLAGPGSENRALDVLTGRPPVIGTSSPAQDIIQNSIRGQLVNQRDPLERARDERLSQERARATAEEQRRAFDAASATADAFGDVISDFNDTRGIGSTGGGGGGAGGPNIEAIRALITEVNRAIGIAARGGVRIGTAGNAIPFEPGTFLNAQQGGLTVDTILIRGVWDFADPASKRLIVRELRDALRGLEAEL